MQLYALWNVINLTIIQNKVLTLSLNLGGLSLFIYFNISQKRICYQLIKKDIAGHSTDKTDDVDNIYDYEHNYALCYYLLHRFVCCYSMKHLK